MDDIIIIVIIWIWNHFISRRVLDITYASAMGKAKSSLTKVLCKKITRAQDIGTLSRLLNAFSLIYFRISILVLEVFIVKYLHIFYPPHRGLALNESSECPVFSLSWIG